MTQCRDAHLMYLGEDIFRMKPTDETLKQTITFIRYAARDTSSRHTYTACNRSNLSKPITDDEDRILEKDNARSSCI